MILSWGGSVFDGRAVVLVVVVVVLVVVEGVVDVVVEGALVVAGGVLFRVDALIGVTMKGVS